MLEKIKPLLFFETIKLVTVHSVKVGLIFRCLQLLVLAYIVVYSIYIQKGYREFSNVDGVIFTKVKGLAYSNVSGEVVVYDGSDITVPPLESNALFITTAFIDTPQERGICLSPTTTCSQDSDCVETILPEGRILPFCNQTVGLCELEGWCPVENDNISLSVQLKRLESVTVFIRSSVQYVNFKIPKSDPTEPIMNRNLFYLKDMLNETNLIQCVTGCIITVDINWDCNVGSGSNPCSPTITFLNNPGGFNYRTVFYSMDKQERFLEKLFGVRFLMQITGRGERFSFFVMVVTIGSGMAFFAAATLIVDLALMFIYRNDITYTEAKWIQYSREIVENEKE